MGGKKEKKRKPKQLTMGRLTPGILTEHRERALGENYMERHYLGKDLGAL